MADVKHYLNDGANRQAAAALAMFQYYLGDGIEASWDDKWSRYTAKIQVARWENCREQGYVLYLRTSDYKHQLNIAFYEHRNSDHIECARWEQITFNAPSLNTPEAADPQDYSYGWENSKSFGYPNKAAEWMFNEFEKFWFEHTKRLTTTTN